MNKKTFLLAGLLAAAVLPLSDGNLNAQGRVNPARTSDLSDDDWNAWRIGVLTAEEADKAYLARNYVNAAAMYAKTLQLFRTLQQNKPHWNKKGLEDRISTIERKLSAAKRRQAEQVNMTGVGGTVEEQKIAAANADAVAEISELKLSLESARKQAARYKESLDRAEKTAKQIDALMS